MSGQKAGRRFWTSNGPCIHPRLLLRKLSLGIPKYGTNCEKRAPSMMGVGSAKGVLMTRKKSQEKTENTVCVPEEGVGSAKAGSFSGATSLFYGVYACSCPFLSLSF